ncbi:MAG TPA: formylglycine-generating enzyme family protein, partial [Candidatus Binatia bacterium]|nr:formylglycine-generating enzyme family protein [Candidatus Binatia bacterium]
RAILRRFEQVESVRCCRIPAFLSALVFLSMAPTSVQTVNNLVPLASPGPWSGVAGLIGYGGRVWFVNSVKFVDHNSADIYSYDPASGVTRFERHLFSQDAGQPTVANGLLYWPFEDARFSTGHGEYMVTNGSEWQWRILPQAEVFHVHALVAHDGALFAATGAWRGGLQLSRDGGITWQVVYDHPTPSGSVSRITSLAVLDGTLYAGLTDYRPAGGKLLQWTGHTLKPVDGWPAGTGVTSLTSFRTWLYAVNTAKDDSAVWRTDGKKSQRIEDLDGYRIRGLAAGPDALWAVSASEGSGLLWRSSDGLRWTRVQEFRDAEPLDILVYAGEVYVGTLGPNGRGTLWGPRPPARLEPQPNLPRLVSNARALAPEPLGDALDDLDRALADGATYGKRRDRLFSALLRLGLAGTNQVGEALIARLGGPFPDADITLYGGQLTATATQIARWNLLWAIALNGQGRVPPELLKQPWNEKPNRSAKYLHPTPAAAWAAAQLGQVDDETLAALIDGLARSDYPLWLKGDFVGALTALTGHRFGYDLDRWRLWWNERTKRHRGAMVAIPAGEFVMGLEQGEPGEEPAHRVELSAYSIDRHETTNAEFAEFASVTGHVTDPERSGVGWDWDGEWREKKNADWRHPHGPESSIQGLDRHPVVQVSWNDARAYCRWRGKRLPTEAEWEHAARGYDRRVYPWGNEPPRKETRYRASYGYDRCCRADGGDGYFFTAPVGSFPGGRSPFGIEDMAGNVWEWVEDTFDEDFYRKSPPTNPVNNSNGERKVIRGGGWGNDPAGLRSTLRHANPPDIGLSMVGFRCAR